MADDLDNKIKQIAQIFGVSDASGLKSIVEALGPKLSQSTASQNDAAQPASSGFDTPGSFSPQSAAGIAPGSNPQLNPGLQLLSKANEMIGAFNNVRDPRINMLNSVSPFLGTARQQRLGSAVQLLKILSVIGSVAPGQNRSTNTRG